MMITLAKCKIPGQVSVKLIDNAGRYYVTYGVSVESYDNYDLAISAFKEAIGHALAFCGVADTDDVDAE